MATAAESGGTGAGGDDRDNPATQRKQVREVKAKNHRSAGQNPS